LIAQATLSFAGVDAGDSTAQFKGWATSKTGSLSGKFKICSNPSQEAANGGNAKQQAFQLACTGTPS